MKQSAAPRGERHRLKETGASRGAEIEAALLTEQVAVHGPEAPAPAENSIAGVEEMARGCNASSAHSLCMRLFKYYTH